VAPSVSQKLVVLIIHEDLGFLCCLSKMLFDEGFETLPALGSRQAIQLVEELGMRVDLIVGNPGILRARGLRRLLASKDPEIKVLPIKKPTSHLLDPNGGEAEQSSLADPTWSVWWFQKVLQPAKLLCGRIGHPEKSESTVPMQWY
jgi:hypothetical protein